MDKVNILSMGWRSHWLARRLKSLGIEVSLFEVTDHAGWSHPEDIDGPFPFSITLHSPEDFVNLAQIDEVVQPLKTGFCLSTPQGNLAWDSLNREAVLQKYMKNFHEEAAEGEKFWFQDFLKSFSKSTFKKASNWGEEDIDFNLKSELHLRRSDRMTYLTSLDLLRERGVEVQSVSHQEIGKILLEVKERPKDWIMGLTIAELRILTSQDKYTAKKSLGWHRRRFFFESKNMESLPLWSIWMESPFRPWKEENQVILIKGRQENYLDVWTLEDIYREGVKEEAAESALKFLNKNFKHTDFAPQESENMEGSLKTLFPVSHEDSLMNDTDYIWNSPMEWGGYSMDLMYKYQYDLAQKIYDKGEES